MKSFPIPNTNEMVDLPHGSKYFSTLNLGNVYNQFELTEESKMKTAFSTKHAQYQFNRMPIGITDAPILMQFTNLKTTVYEMSTEHFGIDKLFSCQIQRCIALLNLSPQKLLLEKKYQRNSAKKIQISRTIVDKLYTLR